MSLSTIQHAVALVVIGGGFLGLHEKIKLNTAILNQDVKWLKVRVMTLEQQINTNAEIARMHDVSLAEIADGLKKDKNK